MYLYSYASVNVLSQSAAFQRCKLLCYSKHSYLDYWNASDKSHQEIKA